MVHRLDRRAFVRDGTLVLSTAMTRSALGALADDDADAPLKVGLVTDLHYADKESAGSRHYRETLSKLEEASEQFVKEKISFLVELGDIIDAADAVETEQHYLRTIDSRLRTIAKERHYVLGNHCVDTLTKAEFLDGVEQEGSYYSFDRQGVHFVILDSCFRSDGEAYSRRNFKWNDANVPAAELEWLHSDLQQTDLPVVVFAHQRLDVSDDHGVRNGFDVRQVLEDSGRVLAVFQGHSHQNDLHQIKGIHYCTLVAMVEGSGAANNGYSVLTVFPDGTLELSGFRQQKSHRWGRH
jgi:predicted phosphodiesterase